MSLYISDPEEYLKQYYPGKEFLKTGEFSLPDAEIPAYIISEKNGCVANAAACLLNYHLKPAEGPSGLLKCCRGTALMSFAKGRPVRRSEASAAFEDAAAQSSFPGADYYIPLGRTAGFLSSCAAAAGSARRAKSSLFARRVAKEEIGQRRPVLLSIAFSAQYRDHTIVAYGWREFAPKNGKGRRMLFFKVRDGYSSEPRWLVYRRIFGIFVTTLK